MKEIITVQFGNKANWVGANYWNLQGSALVKYLDNSSTVNYTMNSVFNETEHHLYYPRCVSFEEKGNFGSINCQTGEINVPNFDNSQMDLSNNVSENKDLLWNGKQNSIIRSNSDNNSLHWSDIYKGVYNPSSLNELNSFTSISPLCNYIQGKDYISTEAFDLHFDSFRKQLESCDSLCLLQCILDIDGGWTGIAQKYIEEIMTEIGSKDILTFGIYDSKQGYLSSIHNTEEYYEDMIMNRYCSLYDISTHSSVYSIFDVSSLPSIFTSDIYSSLYTSTFIYSLLLNITTLPNRFYKQSPFSTNNWMKVMCMNEYRKQINYSLAILDEYINKQTSTNLSLIPSIYIPLYTFNQNKQITNTTHYSINCISDSYPVSSFYEAQIHSYNTCNIYTPQEVPLDLLYKDTINVLTDIKSNPFLSQEITKIYNDYSTINTRTYISKRVSSVDQTEYDSLDECSQYLQNLKEEYSE